MNVYSSVREMIGNTPVLKLNQIAAAAGIDPKVGLYAKLELMNPAGSVKDRVGMYMIDDAKERGILKEGGTIVDATAGNTGIGIAIAALNQGFRVIFTVPEKFSVEKQKVMRALGAEIVHTPREEGMLGADREADRIIAKIPGAISLKQFNNPANPKAHYETTGPEIYQQLDGQIDIFVAGAGSGGTFSGVVKYLKEQNSGIQGVLADPLGSIIGGGEHFDYDIEGIGNDFIADTMDITLVDQVIKISDSEAFDTARLLAKKEGILAGSSSGAALAAAIRLAKTLDHGNVVTIFPDRGDRYLSKGLFD
ncbi:MAG: cysteine synthase family protein [Lachnospiraceae bacterium]|nr:cysteine synthase family protein [Lachnospiraceae bacterium]